ncbi:hypothetical protein L4A43_22065 [Salmonella enterica subsp. diarizonae serovar 16:z10:e,n,x,z15]|uniref:hypothetical protein n=1 Tax=Salmonella enterica TaxID=28901 RepID=UPI0012C61107|nr:hypothetical protein [Salmonella enterica subsp. houtenae serovar 53:z4,z23:-]EEI9429980.1 hypothetical protein [Salmonella enterica subsp. diarizonae]MCH5484386.1 hypothetical protein [Salmonella enterica subsp. diarizonae serovar 16:z10:e,n,x,z15]HAF4898460.1 hypothetical protein [Salmonella enterica]HDI1196482.1 hypothetical protein [Salmonella enterica]
MKQKLALSLVLLTTLSGPAAYAASCAAATAALAGAQAGYEQDRKAAESWSQREKQASTGFSQCLGDISTSVTVPTFPDFSQVFDRIKDKICTTARDKVSSLLPANIDPWGDLGQGYIPTTTIPVSTRSTKSVAPALSPPAPSTGKSSTGSASAYPFSL